MIFIKKNTVWILITLRKKMLWKNRITVLRLIIDNEVFIKIYGNTEKDKLNLTLVFRRKRIYGCDSESGKNHCHPFDDPDRHIFIKGRKSIQEFVQESMKFLEETCLL